MSQIICWKEKAQKVCSEKGLYDLEKDKKDSLCDEALKKLSEIGLDTQKAYDTLELLRD